MNRAFKMRPIAATIATLCLLFLSLFCTLAKSDINFARADGEEPPAAELIVTFDGDEDKTTRSGDVTISDGKAVLASGGTVSVKEKFGSMRLYVGVNLQGTLKITLGGARIYCGADGFSAEGAAITYSDKRELRGDTLISLTLWGKNVEIGAKNVDEPQERLYVTAFKAVLADETSEKISPSFAAENGRSEIDYFEIFSLEPTISGKGEDYDPSHESSAFAEKPLKGKENKKGCVGNVGIDNIGALTAAGTLIFAGGGKTRRLARKTDKKQKRREKI